MTAQFLQADLTSGLCLRRIWFWWRRHCDSVTFGRSSTWLWATSYRVSEAHRAAFSKNLNRDSRPSAQEGSAQENQTFQHTETSWTTCTQKSHIWSWPSYRQDVSVQKTWPITVVTCLDPENHIKISFVGPSHEDTLSTDGIAPIIQNYLIHNYTVLKPQWSALKAAANQAFRW